MEFKGTKGKWTVRESYDDCYDQKVIEIDSEIANRSSIVTVWCGLPSSCVLNNETKANALLISKAPALLDMLSEASSVIQRLKLSILVHPDCEVGSEFDDYTSLAQETENEIEKLIKEATNINHAKENTNS